MKKSEIVDTFVFLFGCYPSGFADMSADRLEQMANSWCTVFCDDRFANLDGRSFMESAKRHVTGERGRYFPTPRDIIEQLPAYPHPKEVSEGADASSS